MVSLMAEADPERTVIQGERATAVGRQADIQNGSLGSTSRPARPAAVRCES